MAAIPAAADGQVRSGRPEEGEEPEGERVR